MSSPAPAPSPGTGIISTLLSLFRPAPTRPAIILTLPTELILEIGEMLDIMSLINLAKTHPLFTTILDDPPTSLISSASARCLRTRPISPHALAQIYSPTTRFDHLDAILAPKELCAHEINLLNYLVEAQLVRSFIDAEAQFAAAVKSVTRFGSVYRRYRGEQWLTTGFAGDVGFGTVGVFEKVEMWLHRRQTEKAVDTIAAVYSHVAEIVRMVDYVGRRAGRERTGRMPRFQASCCAGVRTWEQLMMEVKADPDYKEPVMQSGTWGA